MFLHTPKKSFFPFNVGFSYYSYYGGFLFIEEDASFVCSGATIQGHFAGDQGGALYAQDAMWVNVSCDILGNTSPQGAAAYLTHVHGNVLFEDISITDNVASSGSVVFIAASPVVARAVTFAAGSTSITNTITSAVQLDSLSTFDGQRCSFEGWERATVVYSASTIDGSLVLDLCDFSRSVATTTVTSLLSDAEIRNARVGELTFANAADPLALVDRALTCEDADVCGKGDCVDSSLGVLCECLPNGECLDDGGTLSFMVKTPPNEVTFNPETVSFELLISAAAEDGTTDAIWKLAYDADKLALEVVPSSGILPPGGNATVAVFGSPLEDDVGGDLTSSFTLTTVGTGGGVLAELDVISTFYLCKAFEFAVRAEDSASSATGDIQEIECEQCLELLGDTDGVDCSTPGATLVSLPVRAGFWRSSTDSRTIHSCMYSEACPGATQVADSNDYCAGGYEGPCESFVLRRREGRCVNAQVHTSKYISIRC